MRYEQNILRHELKYYINEYTYFLLRQRIKNIMQPDPFMKEEEGYLITSVYFDDIYHSARNDKVQGTRFRKKYRFRSYDRNDSLIKLECKSKFDAYISKTAVSVTREDYNAVLDHDMDILLEKQEAVCHELYGYSKTRLLKPEVAVEYLREAYIAKEGNVRITFDKHISASIGTLDMFSDNFVTFPVYSDTIMVLEVKYDDFLPGHIRSLLNGIASQKCAISKYVMCIDKKRMVTIL